MSQNVTHLTVFPLPYSIQELGLYPSIFSTFQKLLIFVCTYSLKTHSDYLLKYDHNARQQTGFHRPRPCLYNLVDTELKQFIIMQRSAAGDDCWAQVSVCIHHSSSESIGRHSDVSPSLSVKPQFSASRCSCQCRAYFSH